MPFNLIHASWLPVRRASGRRERIPPWGLTDGLGDDPVMSLDAPRPDLAGGLVQFLVGLVQTCLAPDLERDWRRLQHAPPGPDDLRRAMAAEAEAFVLDGDGPRFLQDLTLSPAEAGPPWPASALFMDAPGENALERNTDFFVKRGRIERLCPACAAAALMTLQSFAPSGGVGHRTSLRGGGPLTTLVLGGNLWQTVWLNVLPKDALARLGCDPARPRAGGVYPWLAPTVTSQGKGAQTLPGDVHPLHVYWSMPRRVRLLFEDGEAAACDVCAETGTCHVRRILTKNYGYNYKGPWRHPLTPYTLAKDAPNPVKGSPAGLSYRQWPGLTAAVTEGKIPREPAQVVSHFRGQRAGFERAGGRPDYRLWAFGYDMDNMKARAWVEGVIPVYELSPGRREDFARWTEVLVLAADQARRNLRGAVAEAFMDESARRRLKWDESLFAGLDTAFWSGTEASFVAVLAGLRDGLEAGAALPSEELRRGWLKTIFTAADRLFAATVKSFALAEEDLARQARAEGKLRAFNSERSKVFTDILDLPAVKPAKTGKGRKPAP
jgi:CRISPR system Cascade subunit CasA